MAERRITLPDGKILAVPDGVPDADIAAALKQNYPDAFADQPPAPAGRAPNIFDAESLKGLSFMEKGALALEATGNPAGVFPALQGIYRKLTGQSYSPEEAARTQSEGQFLLDSLGPLGMEFSSSRIPSAAERLGNPLGSAPIKPNAARVKAESKLNYMAAENAGVKVSGDSFSRMVGDLNGTLAKEGYDPQLHTAVGPVVARLNREATARSGGLGGEMGLQRQPAKPPIDKTLQDLETYRKLANDAAASINPADRRLGVMIKDRLWDYVEKLDPKEVTANAANKSDALKALYTARQQYRQAAKIEEFENILERIGYRSGQFSVSGKENAIRTEFRQLAVKMTRDKRFANSFSPDERRLIKQLGNMGSAVNILRTMGKLFPNNIFSMGGGASMMMARPDLAPLVGMGWLGAGAARLAGLGLTQSKLNQLEAITRFGGRPPVQPSGALLGPQLPLLNFPLGLSQGRAFGE